MTDNRPAFVKALDWLVKMYHIHHIRMSPYNSQAQGTIKCQHFDIGKSLIKAAEGNEKKWHQVAHPVFWAEHVTIQKLTGYSLYYIAHRIDLLLLFDLAKATYMAPTPSKMMSTQDLIISCTIQLQK
jgi:hypothetical protein